MILLLLVYRTFLRFCYFFIKLLPTKKSRITFLSRQTNKPSIDFQYLIADIKSRYPECEIKVLCKRLEKDNAKQIVSYLFHPFMQMLLLATSEICIIDSYQIAVSVLRHKKNLKIIQIWHSLAAIKKSGLAAVNTQKKRQIAKIMCMHKNYDFIAIGSEKMIEHFSKAFGYKAEKFWITGLPRVDYLLKTKERNKAFVQKTYPKLKDAKIVLYAPTFRKNNDYRFGEIIKAFENTPYTLIIKKHPLTKAAIPEKYEFKKLKTIELLSSADWVISDYSGTIIEAAVAERPLLIFNYDNTEFAKNEGFFIDIEKEFQNLSFKTANEIFSFIQKGEYDMSVLKKFREKCIKNTNGNCTENLVNKIMQLKN